MRQKIVMFVVAALLMVAAAAPPALASHGWEPTDWWQWPGSDWWCMGWWFHYEDDEWVLESLICYHPDTGEYWSWPE